MGFETLDSQENLKFQEAMSIISDVLGKNKEKITKGFGEVAED